MKLNKSLCSQESPASLPVAPYVVATAVPPMHAARHLYQPPHEASEASFRGHLCLGSRQESRALRQLQAHEVRLYVLQIGRLGLHRACTSPGHLKSHIPKQGGFARFTANWPEDSGQGKLVPAGCVPVMAPGPGACMPEVSPARPLLCPEPSFLPVMMTSIAGSFLALSCRKAERASHAGPAPAVRRGFHLSRQTLCLRGSTALTAATSGEALMAGAPPGRCPLTAGADPRRQQEPACREPRCPALLSFSPYLLGLPTVHGSPPSEAGQ